MAIAQSQPFDSIPMENLEGFLHICEEEQIHLMGKVQSHGILLGIKESELKIVRISDSTEQFFGLPAISFVDRHLSCLFPQSQIDIFSSLILQENIEIFNPLEVNAEVKGRKYLFQGVVHRADGFLILELEPLSQGTNPRLGFYHLAKSTAISIRAAKDFDEMSEFLVREIRQLTGYDRVLIYRFDPDDSGVVIAEDKREDLEPLLGLHYPASDISEIARQLYYKNWLRIIVDLHAENVPILASSSSENSDQPLDLSFSVLRTVSEYHVRYLENMNVEASLGISLINADRLWGLVICHHLSPKYVGYEIRKTCEFLGQIMSVEIVHKHEQYLKTFQDKIKITQSELKKNILGSYQSIGTSFLEDSRSILDLTNSHGALICLGNQISPIGVCPPSEFIHSLLTWLEKQSVDVLYTDCLSQLFPEAIAVKDQVSGLLAITIALNYTTYHIIWFRHEIIQTVSWAGDPNNLLEIKNEKELSPRRSFALWKETVKAKSLPWTNVEIEAATELRSTLMLAALEFSQQSLKKEAERAHVASEAKSNFLARMSHELRTPLNAILGCAQLMKGGGIENQEIDEYVNIISHSSEHLLSLIDDVLEMSKIEAGKIILEETRFDLPKSLKHLQEIMQIKANEKGLQMIFVIHPNLPQYIKSDERKIRQVLMNLIGNAIKFTDKGYIMVRVALGDSECIAPKCVIHFEVEDTGKGIAAEEKEKLFEPFMQTASGRESLTGTGLGLGISQQFVRFMGGEINVSSTVGKGSTFTFDIVANLLIDESVENIEEESIQSVAPVEKVLIPSLVSKDKATQGEQSDSNSLRILLVEDNQFNQMIALRLLSRLGYKADCAMNGFEVLEAIKIKPYDLILMDIQMPEMDGLEATRRIRLLENSSDTDNNRIVIVAMTANAMAEDRENCFAIGMDDFISKPIMLENLKKVLDKHKKQKTREAE